MGEMGEMGEVVIEYQLTWSEFRSMQWVSSRKKYIVLIIVVLVLASIFAIAGNDVQWWIGMALSAFVFFGMIFWLGPKNYWSHSLGIQESRLVTVGDSGISSKSESLEFKLGWPQITRVDETHEYFILQTKKGTGAFVILKRGIHSADEDRKLRNLLTTHVSLAALDKKVL
jgi:hypothetical protein